MSERRLKLSDQRVREIRALAWHCLNQIGCVAPKVPVDAVAKRLGATVLSSPYDGDDLAGMLIFRGGKPVIAVNSNNHQNRQRFTIAHECGHLLLGHSEGAHVDESFAINRNEKSSDGTDCKEVEANQFAAELLMPLRFLLRDLDEIDFEDDDSIKLLADAYGVSVAAMSFRIAKIFM